MGISLSENPALKAMEAFRRTHPHRSDELDEAFERFANSAAGTDVIVSGEPAAEQLAMDEPLPDPSRQAIGKFNATGPDTQREAAISQWPTSGSKRREMLDYIGSCGSRGATDEEMERQFSGRHQSISARRNELMNDGWLVDSGQRRYTSSGRRAIAWVLSPEGLKQWRPT